MLRLFLGLFGGSFLSGVSFVAVWLSFDPRLKDDTPAALAAVAGFLLGGLAVAYGAFSRLLLLRMVTWAIGGAGLGNVLLVIIRGGLTVGTVLTPSGVVLAVVGAILGYRTAPPSDDSQPVRKVDRPRGATV